jgi:ATP-dependent DNA helicase DinG
MRIAPRHLAPHDEAFTDLEAALDAVGGVLGDAEEPPVKAVSRRAIEIRNDLLFARKAQEPSWVYWFEDRERTSFLKAAPVDVAHELRERFYPRVDTAIFTSATLTAGGRFDFTMSRLGLDAVPREGAAPVDTVALDSPFDFESQAALYAPAHLPEPASPAFLPAAIEEIACLCEVTGGRAFCLFTSLRNMRSAHEALNPRLRYRVLVQGEKPKQRLLTEFRERPSVLFASQSFWEGVDVPGDALSLVVIDKLPFAVPSDPLVAARIDWLKSQERDAFAEYQLPEAAISLRQGFGRLIRTRTDRGIVAVLDPRLSTKRYGRVFVDSLPKCPRFTDLGALAAWWAGR